MRPIWSLWYLFLCELMRKFDGESWKQTTRETLTTLDVASHRPHRCAPPKYCGLSDASWRGSGVRSQLFLCCAELWQVHYEMTGFPFWLFSHAQNGDVFSATKIVELQREFPCSFCGSCWPSKSHMHSSPKRNTLSFCIKPSCCMLVRIYQSTPCQENSDGWHDEDKNVTFFGLRKLGRHRHPARCAPMRDRTSHTDESSCRILVASFVGGSQLISAKYLMVSANLILFHYCLLFWHCNNDK